MKRQRFNSEVVRDPSWSHWTFTIPLLAFNLLGYSWARWTAVGLCAVVAGYSFLQLEQLRAYSVQVRLAYLLLPLCGMPPGMNSINWVPLDGTTAMMVAGYCPLLRLLPTAPRNRAEAQCKSQVYQVLERMPRSGGLLKWSSAAALLETMCCSIRDNQ